MKLIYFLAWIVALGGLCTYVYRFGLSHLYDYRVGEEGVEFRIATVILIFVIRFEKIEDVFEQTLLTIVDGNPASIFRGLAIGNRLATNYVVLKMKTGFFRYIGLTPIDRKAFVAEVKRGLRERSDMPSSR